MRKPNPNDFRVATRTTSREINRQIALNLVREHEPISRAELAKRMKVQKSLVTLIVGELIADGLIYEGGDGESRTRGRKPTLLHVNTRDRLVVAIDIRFTSTYLMLGDFGGRKVELQRFDTIFDPRGLARELAKRVRAMLKRHDARSACVGIGVVAPGLVDRNTNRILRAPALGWRDVDLRDRLAKATGLPVVVENAVKACALAQMWSGGGDGDFVYLFVSDGVGVGAVAGGELLRGHGNVAGEFGHTPVSIDGPACLCGLRGCWEAYTSNLATLSRYLGKPLSRSIPKTDGEALTIDELIARARAGDRRARKAIGVTARYIGIGLATVVAALDPARIYIGGEITGAWDLIERSVREGLAERALTDAAARTPIEIAAVEHPRLSGAVALVAAPMFAAPRVA